MRYLVWPNWKAILHVLLYVHISRHRWTNPVWLYTDNDIQSRTTYGRYRCASSRLRQSRIFLCSFDMGWNIWIGSCSLSICLGILPYPVSIQLSFFWFGSCVCVCEIQIRVVQQPRLNDLLSSILLFKWLVIFPSRWSICHRPNFNNYSDKFFLTFNELTC